MNKILFVDDDRRVLDAYRRIFRPHRGNWEMVYQCDPTAAWEELQQSQFDAVVSDIHMPRMSGLELLDRIKQTERLQALPVIILTSEDAHSLKREVLDRGAADLFDKPVAPEDLVARLRSVLRLKARQDELAAQVRELEGQVQKQKAHLLDSRMDVAWRLGKAAEERDDEPSNHVVRVGCISRLIAETMGFDRAFVDTLFVAAPLHDIGKIGIPDSILLKPGPLDQQEWAVMQRHCAIGARILREDNRTQGAFDQWLGHGARPAGHSTDNPVLRAAGQIALMHHEKWDGSGYPQKLTADQIAIEARIVALADVFDVLNSHRPYRAAHGEDEALEIVRQTAARHFDPDVYAAFRKALPEIRAVRRRFADGIAPSLAMMEEACHESHSVRG
jgi:response regulator RpfG family c-di-GMP phosphodiesterase